MSNIDKRALREAADKATPGRWEYYPGNTSIEYNVDSMVEDQGSIVYVDSGDFTQKQTDLNGTFIAAANPATVLALLDELEAADALNKHFELAIRKAEGCSEALRRKAEAAEKRISELEAREVNLPKLSVGEVMHMSGFSRDYAEGWCSGNDNAIHEIHAAGVKVAAAAGKGE
jgi:hypothetical protein